MRTLHIAVGSIALASMLVPMVAPKGGRTHRTAGWVFVASMSVVVITAVVLSVTRLIVDRSPNGQAAGFFLLYLSIVTGASLYGGLRAVRAKRPAAGRGTAVQLSVALLELAAGLGIAAYGLQLRQTVFVGLSLIGIAGGFAGVRAWRRPRQGRMDWWFDHMAGMLGGCVAATTAFLVNTTGYTGLWPIAAWLAPTAIGVPGIWMWTLYYRRLHAKGLRAQGPGLRAASGI
jgi:hypothetical protein